MSFYSLLITLRARETLPPKDAQAQPSPERFGGYGSVLRDRTFISFWVAFLFNQVAASILWLLLSVYAKRTFNIDEAQYGPIAATNAIMVVLFQVAVTRFVKRYFLWWSMAVGALFYALALTGVAFATGFWTLWLCMIVLTIGELIITPTASTLVANLAPPDKRGRYMSIYGLNWSVAAGIGPVAGGYLSDKYGPQATWYGGGFAGMISTLLFTVLSMYHLRKKAAPDPSS
jgi:predicted MFS family arabinose efflux permease